jgi:hypothetical protein
VNVELSPSLVILNIATDIALQVGEFSLVQHTDKSVRRIVDTLLLALFRLADARRLGD